MADIATVAQELAAENATAVAPTSAPSDAAAPAEAATLIGVLDADQRIRANAEQNERTLWASAAFVTLLYVAVIAAQLMNLGGFSGIEQELERQRKERMGQGGDSVSVELVPEPDFKAKTEKWRDGANQPPNPAPPQPQQQAALPQPPVEQPQPTEKPSEEPAKDDPQEQQETAEKEQESEKEQDKEQSSMPSLEALVDAAASDLQEQVKAHYDRKQMQQRRPQRQQQAMFSGGGMQVRGTGAGGKSDAFNKSVIDALIKTRPGPLALWGRVLVTLQITQQGDLLYVRVLHSSGNKAMDDAAVIAIHRAKFTKPPEGLSAEGRTYIIDYVFG
jgi:TonB family protein